MLLLALATAGCAAPSPDAPPSAPANYIGMKVGEAIEALHLALEEHFVVYEPPGVARGVDGRTGDGTEVRLYFERYETPGLRHNLTLKDVTDFPVIGIARRLGEEWKTEGKVIWYYHDK